MKKPVGFWIVGILFFLVFFVGVGLRIHNITPFKIYPDAYQVLLVAENIRNYHSVVGYLGPDGMVFPPFFMWTRPGFPLLLNVAHLFFSDTTKIAQYLSFFAGILAIPLSFFLVKRIFNSVVYGLVGIGLFAFSFNHTVWSGFIMTETLGVLLLFILLLLLFGQGEKKTSWADPWDFLIGGILAFAVLTRYEYIVLIPAVSLLIYLQTKQSFVRITNIAAVFILVIAIAVTQLYPLSTLSSILLLQHGSMIGKLALISIPVLILVFMMGKFTDRYKKKAIDVFSKVLVVFLWTIVGYALLQTWIGNTGLFLWHDLEALKTFLTQEILISLFFMIGISVFLWKKTFRVLGWFVMLSVLLLGSIYYLINPGMDRYTTHLLPFLVIPATYGVMLTYSFCRSLLFSKNRDRKLEGVGIAIFLVFLVILQTILTYDGIRHRRDRSWFETSYDEQAAILAKPYIPPSSLLLVSFPESYYYFSQNSTHSVSDTYPFVYIPDSLHQKEIIIIVDMGMYDLFPHFAQFVEKHFAQKKIGEFWVERYYHYAYSSLEENTPVSIYRVSLSQLKKSIQSSQNR